MNNNSFPLLPFDASSSYMLVFVIRGTFVEQKGREKAKGTGTCIRCNNQTGIGVTFLFLFRRPFFPGSSSPPSLSSLLSA